MAQETCKATGQAHEWHRPRPQSSVKVCVWCHAFRVSGEPIVAVETK
jgi:hypothetical protein